MINVSLKVNGYMLSGFDDLRVSLNLYSLSNLARLSFTEKDGDSLVQAKKIITANAEAVVYFDDKPVVSGYIYQPVPGFSDAGAGLDVIVTSPIAKYIGQAVKIGKIYYNQKISAILADLCPDIGLEIRNDKVLPKFVIYGFELVDRVIQKLCNKTDSVIYSGAYGQLVIDSRSEYAGTSGIVATGKNVLAIGRVEKNDDTVVIAGQLPFDDNVSLDAAVCTKISAAGSGKTHLYYGDDVSPAAVSAAHRVAGVSAPPVRKNTVLWFMQADTGSQAQPWAETRVQSCQGRPTAAASSCTLERPGSTRQEMPKARSMGSSWDAPE